MPVRCLEFLLVGKMLSPKNKDISMHKWTNFCFFSKSEVQMEHYVLFSLINSCFICFCFRYTKEFTAFWTVKL